MGMQVTLFKALRSVKVGSVEATNVIDELEGHIAMKITEANKELVSELRAQRLILNFLALLTTASAIIGGYIALILK